MSSLLCISMRLVVAMAIVSMSTPLGAWSVSGCGTTVGCGSGGCVVYTGDMRYEISPARAKALAKFILDEC